MATPELITRRRRTRLRRDDDALVPAQGQQAGAEAAAPAERATSRHGNGLQAGRPRFADRTLLRYGVAPLLVTSDLLAAALGGAAAGISVLLTAAVAVVLVGMNWQRCLHRGRLTLSVIDDLPALTGRSLMAVALVAAVAELIGSPTGGGKDSAFALLLAGLPALVVLRLLAYETVRQVRIRRVVEHPTLVLGAGVVAGQLTDLLLEHPEYGLLPIGMLDDDPLLTADQLSVPVLGGSDALAKVLVEFRVRNVIVAFGRSPASSLVDVIRTCDRFDCEVFTVPRLYEVHASTRDTETVWGLPLVRLPRAAFKRPAWKAKRLLDIVLSLVALVLLSPVLLALAAAVRLDSGKGVLFRQTRIGMDNRPFEVLKFRSLRPTDDLESRTRWNVAQDLRMGRVGRVLRATSLDELPQLWNILRGDMTFVGPRPERPHFVEEFSQMHTRYVSRHRVPAGLTGWAQIHGLRGDTSIAERARFDNVYIENWSFWGDLKIILRTVPAVLRRRGS